MAVDRLLTRNWQPLGASVTGNGTTNLLAEPANGIPTRCYRVRAVDP